MTTPIYDHPGIFAVTALTTGYWWLDTLVLVATCAVAAWLFLPIAVLWLQCRLTGAPIGLLGMARLKLDGVDYRLVARNQIALTRAGCRVPTIEQAAHYLSRGNLAKTVGAVIMARKGGMDLPWRTLAAIDLCGRDVVDAVKTALYPKVVDCPSPAKGERMISAVCRNGIQLRVRARITLRTKPERLIGGATEDTIIARVSEGIIQAIGNAETHADILANPALISAALMSQGLDKSTGYDIVSIDIAELDVGENVGANVLVARACASLAIERFGTAALPALQEALKNPQLAALAHDIIRKLETRGSSDSAPPAPSGPPPDKPFVDRFLQELQQRQIESKGLGSPAAVARPRTQAPTSPPAASSPPLPFAAGQSGEHQKPASAIVGRCALCGCPLREHEAERVSYHDLRDLVDGIVYSGPPAPYGKRDLKKHFPGFSPPGSSQFPDYLSFWQVCGACHRKLRGVLGGSEYPPRHY